MFTRLLAVAIVLFWGVMNVSLLQLWISPGGSDVLSIPVAHVGKQIFLHEQTSDLSISQGGRPVGSVTFQPRRFDNRDVFLVDYSGNLLLSLPFLPQQPLSWHGTVEMNQAFAVQYFKIHVDARLQGVSFELEVDPPNNIGRYTVRQDGQEPQSAQVPLNEAGIKQVMTEVGVEPALFESLLSSTKAQTSGEGGVVVSARKAQIKIHGEQVQTFNILLRQSATTLAEVDISQLGQILSLKTAFGFSMAPQE